MATVISLTEDKIQELMSSWELLGLTQDQINVLVLQLQGQVQQQQVDLQEWSEVVKPRLEADLAAGADRISELNDTIIPDLEANLAQAEFEINNLVTVEIPALQTGLVAEITNNIERPKVYVQPDEPTNPDIDDRFLVVGDSWFDSDDNNAQRIWNGSEWSTFNIDIPDFSLTVKKFLSTSHMIY